MSYLLDKKKKNKKIRNFLLVILLLVILFFFNNFIFKSLSSISVGILRPVFVLGNNLDARVDNFFSYFSSKKYLELENQSLLKDREMLTSQLANYKTLSLENQELKNILNRKPENQDFTLATVLVKPNISVFDIMIIDIGSNAGVSVGDLVFAYGNTPIGKVAEVYDDTSKVVLFSTSGEKTGAIISGRNIAVDLIGRGGGNFEIILPRDLSLEKGTEIILPNTNSYVVAKVETVISDPRDSYQKAILSTPINIFELRFVEVVK
ncbi:MAG: rod shape-determining protein MreC [Candidatus Paceibacterota bacterium]